MTTKVDLQQLAVDRTAEPASGRRRWLTRFVLPAVLLAGFGALLAYAVQESLSPPRSVTVVPVIVSEARLTQAARASLERLARRSTRP